MDPLITKISEAEKDVHINIYKLCKSYGVDIINKDGEYMLDLSMVPEHVLSRIEELLLLRSSDKQFTQKTARESPASQLGQGTPTPAIAPELTTGAGPSMSSKPEKKKSVKISLEAAPEKILDNDFLEKKRSSLFDSIQLRIKKKIKECTKKIHKHKHSYVEKNYAKDLEDGDDEADGDAYSVDLNEEAPEGSLDEESAAEYSAYSSEDEGGTKTDDIDDDKTEISSSNIVNPTDIEQFTDDAEGDSDEEGDDQVLLPPDDSDIPMKSRFHYYKTLLEGQIDFGVFDHSVNLGL